MPSPFFNQVWTCSGVVLNVFGQGMALAYTSCLLLGLQQDGVVVTPAEAGWLGSSIGISSVIGCFICSILMNRIGRRLTHLLLITPCVIAWTIIYFSRNLTTIIIGRIINGLGNGSTIILGAIVIGEYTSPRNRGWMVNFKNTTLFIGASALHLVTHFFHWRTVALICAIPLVLGAAINVTWSESPSWLIAKKKFEEGELVFFKLRGKGSKAVHELDSMIKEHDKVEDCTNQSIREMFKDFFRRIVLKDFWQPILTINIAFLLVEACGRHTFSAYATTIISKISSNPTHSFYYIMAIDILSLISSFSSCILIKHVKRRSLLFFSGITSLITILLISLYLYLVSINIISSDRSWIPLNSLVLFFIFANLGCMPIPLTLLGELLPLQHKAVGMGFFGVISSMTVSVGLKATPTLIESTGIHGYFFTSAVVIALTLVYLYSFLPETKDRTLQEIENYYKYGKFVDYIIIDQRKEIINDK